MDAGQDSNADDINKSNIMKILASNQHYDNFFWVKTNSHDNKHLCLGKGVKSKNHNVSQLSAGPNDIIISTTVYSDLVSLLEGD